MGKESVFRKETMDRISSPDQLTDYLKVTNPGIWIIMAIALVLIGSLLAWASIGTLETKREVKVSVENHRAEVISLDGTELAEGMPLRVSGEEVVLASSESDDYGRSVGIAEVMLPDGTYEGMVVTESIRPLKFLLESR